MKIHPEYMPIHPTYGLHDVYIFHDKEKMWFKIGMTVGKLEDRRRAVCRHEYGRQSNDKIVTHYSWQVQDFFTALYLERTLIGIIRRFEFAQVRQQDWFAIDKLTIGVVIRIVDDIFYDIREWEKDNFEFKSDTVRYVTDRPYCVRASKIGRKELSRRAEGKSGSPR
jgi:hypothetical protein